MYRPACGEAAFKSLFNQASGSGCILALTHLAQKGIDVVSDLFGFLLSVVDESLSFAAGFAVQFRIQRLVHQIRHLFAQVIELVGQLAAKSSALFGCDQESQPKADESANQGAKCARAKPVSV